MGEISSEALLLTRESENACWCGRRHDIEQGQVGKGYLVGGYGPERRAHISETDRVYENHDLSKGPSQTRLVVATNLWAS